MWCRYVQFLESEYLRSNALTVKLDMKETGGVTLAIFMRFTIPSAKRGEDKPLRIVLPTSSGCVCHGSCTVPLAPFMKSHHTSCMVGTRYFKILSCNVRELVGVGGQRRYNVRVPVGLAS